MRYTIPLLISIFFAIELNAQNSIGQFYSVQDPKNPKDPAMKIRYRLDSIVGDVQTGLLTIYQSIGGNAEKMIYIGSLGHEVGYTIKNASGASQSGIFYADYPSVSYRNLFFREIFSYPTTESNVATLIVSFDKKKNSLIYNSVPIKWRKPDAPEAGRPAEYYIFRDNRFFHNGSKVTPYEGTRTKKLSDQSSSLSDGYDGSVDIAFNRKFDFVLKGLVGEKNSGIIVPIFGMKNYNDADYYPHIIKIVIYDEEGLQHIIEKDSFTETYTYFCPASIWTEINDLSTTVSPSNGSLQKMTVLVSYNSSFTTERVYEFRDIPIQWLTINSK